MGRRIRSAAYPRRSGASFAPLVEEAPLDLSLELPGLVYGFVLGFVEMVREHVPVHVVLE